MPTPPSERRPPALATSLHETRLAELERRDLEAQIEAHHAAARKHGFWAVMGFSPGAVLPFLVSMESVGPAALVAGVLAMTGIEGWRAVKARREAAELERTLAELAG